MRVPGGKAWIGRALTIGAAVVVSLVAIGFIARHFEADRIATATPNPTWPSDGTARRLGEGEALLGQAQPDIPEAQRLATDALASSPLSTASLGLLAEAAGKAGDQAAVDRYQALIAERTNRNIAALVWKFDDAAKRRDFVTMTDAADALLRQDQKQEAARRVMVAMSLLTTDPEAMQAINGVISRPTGWRETFLSLVGAVGPIDSFPALMDALPRELALRMTSAWNTYFYRLSDQGQSRRAYAMWTGLLTPEQLSKLTFVNNGGFETAPSGSLFDWMTFRQDGLEFSYDKVDPGEGETSLRITFSGTPMHFRNLLQTLVLDPGRYEFSGMVKTDLATSRGLQFLVYCFNPDGATPIGASPLFKGTSGWTRFSFKVEVPARACDYQTLRLDLPARIDAEKRIQGQIWLDGIAIAPKIDDQPSGSSAAGG